MHFNVFNTELDVSYTTQHTFSSDRFKFLKTIYIVNIRGLEPKLQQ